MTPFTQAPRNPIEEMIRRQALLNHPCEFFRGFFGGRVPSLEEKVLWVEQSMQHANPLQTWENDTYIVRVYHEPPFIQLDISRKDEKPCENWRHFQQIKNELVGPEFEAVELYPAETRLVDTANQYHLWVYADPNYRFPFGFQKRIVLAEPIRVEHSKSGMIRTTIAETVPLDCAGKSKVAGTS
jgi:hypothetical protein